VTALIVPGVIIASMGPEDNQCLLLDRKKKRSIGPEAGTRRLTRRIRLERLRMKKIVIISQQGRINDDLVALLTALFPECDISIAVPGRQGFEVCSADSFSKTDIADETGTQSCRQF
jgi:hypothetical protein